MRRFITALAMACLLPCLGVAAQSAKEGNTVTEAEMTSAVLMGSAVQVGSVLEAFGYSEPWFAPVFLGTVSLQHVPGLVFHSDNAWANMGAQLALDGMYFANTQLFGSDVAATLLFNAAHKFAMFGTYDTYADMRSRSEDESLRAGFERCSLFDLTLASFQPESYEDWTVWGYLGTMAVYAVVNMLGSDGSSAVWTTGTAYIGDYQFSPWAGIALILLFQIPNFIMTGIGEESLYRGVYYEELSRRCGVWPAKVIDATYFTLSHYPQQWDTITAMPVGTLALKNALSIGQTFWLQYIYERKGLKAAVAAHAMSDIMLFFCDWLVQGGVPNKADFSINNRQTLSISFPL